MELQIKEDLIEKQDLWDKTKLDFGLSHEKRLLKKWGSICESQIFTKPKKFQW